MLCRCRHGDAVTINTTVPGIRSQQLAGCCGFINAPLKREEALGQNLSAPRLHRPRRPPLLPSFFAESLQTASPGPTRSVRRGCMHSSYHTDGSRAHRQVKHQSYLELGLAGDDGRHLHCCRSQEPIDRTFSASSSVDLRPRPWPLWWCIMRHSPFSRQKTFVATASPPGIRSVPTTNAAVALMTNARAPMQLTMKPGWLAKMRAQLSTTACLPPSASQPGCTQTTCARASPRGKFQPLLRHDTAGSQPVRQQHGSTQGSQLRPHILLVCPQRGHGIGVAV